MNIDLAPTDKGTILAYALVQARIAERSGAARADGGLAVHAKGREQRRTRREEQQERKRLALKVTRSRAGSSNRRHSMELSRVASAGRLAASDTEAAGGGTAGASAGMAGAAATNVSSNVVFSKL